MKATKRLLSILLTVLLLLGTVAFALPAAAETPDAGFCGVEGAEESVGWSIDENGALTITGTGAIRAYGHDHLYDANYTLYSLAPWQRLDVTSVTVGSGVTNIPDYLFINCVNLLSVSLPDTVTTIGSNAFKGDTALCSVAMPAQLVSLGSYAFSGCSSLPEITIPSGLTVVETEAFSGCTALTQISIPDGVTKVKDRAFYQCTNLAQIEFPDSLIEIETIDALSGTAWSAAQNGRITYCGRVLYSARNLPAESADVVVKNDTASITDMAFSRNTNLRSVSIPGGVQLGKYIFEGCTNLTTVSIAEGVEQLSENLFIDCTSLTDVSLPQSLTLIGPRAFFGCTSLTSVTIPPNVTTIQFLAFYGCTGLTHVTLPNCLSNLDDANFCTGIFWGCTGLTSVSISASAQIIYDGTFRGCTALTDVYFAGTEAQWEALRIDAHNEPLDTAEIHYNAACETHTPAAPVETVQTPASCENAGTMLQTTYCSFCGAKVSETTTEIPALGHDLIEHAGKTPTCGEGGWDAYETCSRCDYTTYQAIPATGNHTAGTPAETVLTPATCGAAGSKQITVTCTVCGSTLSDTTETIPATGAHNWKWIVDTEATCATAGVKHEECSGCQAKRNENTDINPTGIHTYTAATIKDTALKSAAACAKNAVYYYSCKDCGAVESNDSHTFEAEGTALRHVSSDWIIDQNATCKVAGSKHIECTVCHVTLETQPIDKLPHTPQTVPGKAATCKETGLTDGVVCSVCGDVIRAQTVIGKTAHQWNGGTVTTQPTCTAAGVKTFTCTACGDAKTEAVAALGHAWGGWTVTKQPTCTQEGQQTRTCTRDGSHKETQPIAKKSHTDNGNGYCKDCGADLKASQRCKYCGEIHTGPFAWLIKFFHSILAIFKR